MNAPTLSDGRPGLRSTMHIEIREPTADPLSPSHGERDGERGPNATQADNASPLPADGRGVRGEGSSALDSQPILDFIAVFGAMSFWWMGEHGNPRIDTNEHVWFANDQLAVRFIEEIDFDYAATDATAALITAAS